MHRPVPTRARAFTLLEVLMVIIIIGVLTAVVVPGLGALDAHRQEAGVAEIVRTLRYARATAMATGSPTGVRLRTDDGIRLDVVTVDPDTLAVGPAAGPLGVALATRRLDREFPSLAIDTLTDGDGSETTDETIWFKFDGTPHTRSGAGVFDEDNTDDAEIVVGVGGATRTIVVRAHSGAIDEQ